MRQIPKKQVAFGAERQAWKAIPRVACQRREASPGNPVMCMWLACGWHLGTAFLCFNFSEVEGWLAKLSVPETSLNQMLPS